MGRHHAPHHLRARGTCGRCAAGLRRLLLANNLRQSPAALATLTVCALFFVLRIRPLHAPLLLGSASSTSSPWGVAPYELKLRLPPTATTTTIGWRSLETSPSASSSPSQSHHRPSPPLLGPYPTRRKPPCRWLEDVALKPAMECVELLGKTVGLSYPLNEASPLFKVEAWSTAPRLANCSRPVDIWILGHRILTSRQLPEAIAAHLSNAPSVVAVDNSGEVGEMEFANCFFNEMLAKRSIQGADSMTFILASQVASLHRPGQRLFNQHWMVPKRLFGLEQTQLEAERTAAVAALTSGAFVNNNTSASIVNENSNNNNDNNNNNNNASVSSARPGPSAADSLDRSALSNVMRARVLCLGGFPRPHKLQFMGELDARGLLERMQWSAGSPEPWLVDNLSKAMVAFNYTAEEAGRAHQFMRNRLPHALDLDRGAKKANDMTFKSALYDLAPVHLVIESNDRTPSLDRHACARTCRYTEKTLKSMYAKARFVVFGDPGTLQLLRDHGFQTFHPHINETYDAIPTYKEKVEALAAEVDRLLSLTDKEFDDLVAKTQPVVDHNRQWLLSDAFADKVYRQSLYAFGLSDVPAFESPAHERMLDGLYASLGMDCKATVVVASSR